VGQGGGFDPTVSGGKRRSSDLNLLLSLFDVVRGIMHNILAYIQLWYVLNELWWNLPGICNQGALILNVIIITSTLIIS
jgi:hypothetical protein